MTQDEHIAALEFGKDFLQVAPLDNPKSIPAAIYAGGVEPRLVRVLYPRTFRAWFRESMCQLVAEYQTPSDLGALVRAHPQLRELKTAAMQKQLKARAPWEARKRMFGEFASVVGLTEKWTLLHPFDDLNGDEMKQAVAAATAVPNPETRAKMAVAARERAKHFLSSGRAWTPEEDALVRTLPAPEVARRTARSLTSVYSRRLVHQVPDGRRSNPAG